MPTIQAHIGREGERAAMQWLRSRGYMICELNWRAGRYEIDIIATKWGVLHIVEVKSRKVGAWSRGEDAITEAKFRSLARAARVYVAQKGVRDEVQFDLITVEVDNEGGFKIEMTEQAMEFRW